MNKKHYRVKKLKDSRELMELRQIDIAKDMKVAPTTVSGWENEQDTIPFKRLIQYANLYNFRLDYLFGISKNIYCNNKISKTILMLYHIICVYLEKNIIKHIKKLLKLLALQEVLILIMKMVRN